ncbi:hypothetical protein BOX15_Mlig006355g1 [Macrostomum lignano]|uniref:Uncharacterized protein n=1 Tax=Macrostomum lignano TaxID=282301 RepID=A0A267EZ25_9PLAT|nr:hypothetical protein BOX15_Mlig006355g1 [Macrostomum lignano]
MSAEFQVGLLGCFNDCGLCVLTYFVPCYTFGKNAEAVGENCILCGFGICCGLGFILGPIVRGKIREKQNIPGSFITDYCIWFFCAFCALVQEAQEVKSFGGYGMAVERE